MATSVTYRPPSRLVTSCVVVLALAALLSCRADSTSGPPTGTRGPTTAAAATETLELEPAPTAPPAVTVAVPSPTPSKLFGADGARESPAATPQRLAIIARCCGVIDWLHSGSVVVYDLQPEPGLWLIDPETLERRLVGRGFGVAEGRSIALLDPEHGLTQLFETEGRPIDRVETGWTRLALSPNGRYLAWLEVAHERVPSSFVAQSAHVVLLDRETRRTVRLGPIRVKEFAWSGTSSYLVIIAETIDGGRTGLWVVSPSRSGLHLVVEGRFFAGLQVIPDQDEVIVTRVLSGHPQQDGVWRIDLVTATADELPIPTNYRVSREAIWVLDHSGGDARLLAFTLEDIEPCAAQELGEAVRGDAWEVSYDGRWVAYWSAQSGQVRLEPLAPCPQEPSRTGSRGSSGLSSESSSRRITSSVRTIAP